MSDVRWLSVHANRGVVHFIGPVTGTPYDIDPRGTPVSEYDFDAMLEVLADPCCGKELPPWAEKVRLFRPHSATARQVQMVPEGLYKIEIVMPDIIPLPKKLERRARYDKFELEKEPVKQADETEEVI